MSERHDALVEVVELMQRHGLSIEDVASALENTEEFKDRYRYRSGVEATMSSYDRSTGVKRLRFRGLKAVRFCATMKALGFYRFSIADFRHMCRRVHWLICCGDL